MGETLNSDQYPKHLFQRMRNGDVSEVVKAYDKATALEERLKLIPTMHNDTILHIAIHMRQESMALKIIERSSEYNDELITRVNAFGNTALHEAAATGCVRIVEELLKKAPALLSAPNKKEEMPLYTAAYFGQKEIFILLAKKLEQNYVPDLRLHLCSPHGSVLHAAIHAEYFELSLWIARKHEYAEIVQSKNENSKTPLQILSSNPSAFKSGMKFGLIKKFLYYCAPYENDAKKRDADEQNSSTATLRRVISSVNRWVWSVLKAWKMMKEIYDEKKKHGLVLELAQLLIAKDFSWEQSNANTRAPNYSPLFTATRNGIIEIVEEILEAYPLALKYTNEEEQNILHLSIMHRQSHIVKRVRKRLTPESWLARESDKNGFTILHHVGNMKFYNGGTQPGPVLQLQEELKWYQRVEKLVPRYYARQRSNNIKEQKEILEGLYHRIYEETVKALSENKDKVIAAPKSVDTLGWDESDGETPREYFSRTHGDLLKEAQERLNQTSNSCSLVAGLIASVAFAATFTVPGGNDVKNGHPILVNNPFFLVFIIADALSFASSLTSLAMFLSILSSPYDLDEFCISLPRKLILGLAFLFFSVAATSLAFASTMMLTIPIKKRLMTTAIYCVAFLPVTMSAMLQYLLYVAFKRTLKSTFKAVKGLLPCP